MADSETKYVVCPFYLRMTGNTVSCEGVEDGAETQINFPSREKRLSYCRSYCCSVPHYRDCRIASMLFDKYET